MIFNSDIVIGNKLEIRKIRRTNDSEGTGGYVSSLLKWEEDDKARIAAPVYQGNIVQLEIGEQYLLWFFTSKGMFRCKCMVIDQYRMVDTEVVIIQFLSEIESYQRRNYFRLEYIIPLEYYIITENEQILYKELENSSDEQEKSALRDKLELLKGEVYQGTLLDISGGGMRFNSGVHHSVNDMLIIRPKFSDKLESEIEYIKAKIIMSVPVVNKTNTVEQRVKFVDMKKDKRESLIRYIFKKERML